MNVIKDLLFLFTVKEKRKLSIILFIVLINGLLEIIGIGSIMPFISVASNPESIFSNDYLYAVYTYFNFQSFQPFLTLMGIAVIILIVINNLFRVLMTYILKRYGAMRLHSLSMRLLDRYLQQPYIYFVNRNSSELEKNILGELSVVINRVLMPGLEMIAYGVVSLLIIGLLIFIDPFLAFSVAVVLSSSYILIYLIVRRNLLRLGKERLHANNYKFKYTSEALSGIKDVKLLHREKAFLNLFEGPSRSYSLNDSSVDIISDVPKYGLETVAFGGILLILLYLINYRGNFQQIFPIIGLYAFAGYRLMPSLQKVFKGLTKIRYHSSIVGYIRAEFEKAPAQGTNHDKDKTEQRLKLDDSISLKNIVFAYPNTQEPIIKNQSLTIQANTTVGLVGSTGCGKTTLVDIILGLLEPQQGSISIDGVKIILDNISNWQANLGYVPQSIFLTDDTIARNIAFGIADEDIDLDAVKRAAEVANLAKFIEEELEHGFETVVGERGIRLSGGQRQRIGIARAVYHNPSVLILDEATSALDGLTELAIMDAIHNLSHQKTIIMIAHRLTTVKECDVIHIMDKGRILDSGKYNELIMRNDQFRRMAEGS